MHAWLKMPRRFVAMSLPVIGALLLYGCQSAPPPSDLDKNKDEDADGFVDVAPPDGVAFDEATNVSVRFINNIEEDDLADIAEAQGVPQEFVNLLPLVSLVAKVKFTLHYEDGVTGGFTESATIEPFEKSFEFACPRRVDVVVSADAYLPIGGVQPLLDGAELNFVEGSDFNCGETIGFESFVDDKGQAHFEELDEAELTAVGE